MSYQVLARKWRPHSFGEMVGQEHVLRALINALDNDRLHHAFLFTGTRGVGKTTVARILAKSLNCERGVSSKPCGECASCREIDEGRFVDLIEVDAASRTKVEDTRELLDNVQYAPTRGRYKVYLIDEVHMLSGHSFNALLKTLEEPPPHIKFLLATTDPQKLPITILSRCLQFNLKRLPPEQIREHLARVLEREGIPSEPAALHELARAADGSMRDALSLLDQAIAYGDGRVGTAEVHDMLGTVDRGSVVALLGALAAGEAPQVLEKVRELAVYGPDFAGILGELISLLHRVAVLQMVPGAAEELDTDGTLQGLAERMAPEDVQLFYQIALIGRRDLPLAPDARSGLEMVLLRMLAFRPTGASALPAPPSSPPRTQAAAPAPQRPVQPAPAPVQPRVDPAPQPGPATNIAEPRAEKPETAPRQAEGGERDWNRLVEGLGLGGVTRQLALHSAVERWEGAQLDLILDPAFAHLLNKKREEALAEALQAYLGAPVRLTVRTGTAVAETPAQAQQRQLADRQREAEAAIENDPVVKSILDRFEGSIQPGSVRPTKA